MTYNRNAIVTKIENLKLIDLAHKIRSYEISTLKQVDRYLSLRSRERYISDKTISNMITAFDICKAANMPEA